MSNPASETIPGSYILQKMPDGQEISMHRLSDGTWVTTKERLEQEAATEKFMKQFTDKNEAKPDEFKKINTDILTPKLEILIGRNESARRHLTAWLEEILRGKPNEIISGKDLFINEAVAEVKSKPGHFRHVVGMIDLLIKIFNDSDWKKVKEYLIKEDVK